MRRQPIAAIVTAAAILGPAAATVISIYTLIGASPSDFRPYLNDEVYYWHQIATAAAAGAGGGYYGSQERTAAYDVVRFGGHGPVFPLLVGTAARVTGWHRASGPVFNLAWIGLGTIALLILARPSGGRTLLLAILLATFWPLPFWAASNMQESFHHGIAIALAGALISLARGERAGRAAAWALVLLAVATRPSWGVLLPGLCIMSMRHPTAARAVVAGAAGLVLSVAATAAFSAVTPPVPGAFEFLHMFRVEGGPGLPIAHVQSNLRRLMDTIRDYDLLEIVHRVQYLTVTLVVAAAAVVVWARPRQNPVIRGHVAMQASSLVGIVAAMVILYTLTNWTEHRIISSHLLLAAVTLVLLPGRVMPAIAGVLIATNLATLPVYVESFRQNRTDNYVWDRRSLRNFEEALGGRVVFRHSAPPWCNTLLTTQYPPDLVALPAGIGIMVARQPEDIPAAPRSRYLLLDAPAAAAVGSRLRLERLGAVSYGSVYINHGAHCGG